MTGADLLPAAVLKRKAVVYVRQSNFHQATRSPMAEDVGVVGTVDGVKGLAYDLPAQEKQISEGIMTGYNAPNERAVNEAKKRVMSDRCDDRQCTDQERSAAIVIVERDQLIKNVITESTNDIMHERKTAHIESVIGIVSLSIGGIALARRRRT